MKLKLGDKVVTRLPPVEFDTGYDSLHSKVFAAGRRYALSGGSISNCPWSSGVTAEWWRAGFSSAEAKGASDGVRALHRAEW
ncbi:hypothetical protein [Chromobacterium haemolyticum]|uniref:hypothetical protein n=1 Tax=Chromobacterium haemolyticum TaxID=394935 RepID=UPI0013183562|nr:hypothetical protein [Chromobacterium haemolyticum]BBH11786.1 hypothetical protein CH06BL_10340 [Chromobacterium haemolyticum]